MTNSNVLSVLLAMATLCWGTLGFAAQSYNGYSGYIYVPSAKTIERRAVGFNYNTALEKRDQLIDGHNYLFSFGFFDNLEVIGRIAAESHHENVFENPGSVRDLSASAKFRLPLIKDKWFDLALGRQDVGGEVDYFSADYLVLSKDLSWLSTSVGVGRSSSQLGKLSGPFGGVEAHINPWLDVLGEYDGGAFNGGIRLSYNFQSFQVPIKLDMSVIASTEANASNDIYWGVGFTFPLGRRYPSDRMIESAYENWNEAKTYSIRAYQQLSQRDSQNYAKYGHALRMERKVTPEQVLKRLSNEGFENLKVEISGDTVKVVLENNRYNHNELDGIGVALGIISEFSEQIQNYDLTILNQGFEMVTLSGDLKKYHQFLNAPCSLVSYQCIGLSEVADSITVKLSSNTELPGSWGEYENETYLRPRITLAPRLSSGVATEFGVYDYSLALHVHTEIPLWKGGAITSSHRTDAFLESDDYQEGGRFEQNSITSGRNSLLFRQTVRPFPHFYNMISVGEIFSDYVGAWNDATLNLVDGKHKLKFELGTFEHKEQESEEKDYQVVSYRYFNPDHDASFEVKGGTFWDQEQGFISEFKFHFGRSAFGLVYRKFDFEKIGISMYLPLTPWKDMAPTQFGQVKGLSDWRYEVNTVINSDSGRNSLVGRQGVEIRSIYSIERSFLNKDRMSAAYFRKNLYQLRDAYFSHKASTENK
jgi:hypothetical protein